MIKINLTSVMVDDQDKALRFYTEVLGFVKKTEIPMGQFKWLTVVSPDAPDGIELVLEPNAHPAAKTFQKALPLLPDGASIILNASIVASKGLSSNHSCPRQL